MCQGSRTDGSRRQPLQVAVNTALRGAHLQYTRIDKFISRHLCLPAGGGLSPAEHPVMARRCEAFREGLHDVIHNSRAAANELRCTHY